MVGIRLSVRLCSILFLPCRSRRCCSPSLFSHILKMKSNKLNALALTCIAGALPTLAQQCSTVDNVFITFYGWPDNSPPGADNAFDCGRGKGPDGEPIAGGTQDLTMNKLHGDTRI